MRNYDVVLVEGKCFIEYSKGKKKDKHLKKTKTKTLVMDSTLNVHVRDPVQFSCSDVSNSL